MNKTLSTLIGTSVLASGLTLTSYLSAPSAQAYTLTEDPACDVAAAVFSPEYSDCVGAYLLDGGENDVTNGDADNIVSQLLNVQDVFGTEVWSFLGKVDTDGGSNSYFTVNGIDSTTGTITFDVNAINNDFGPSFLEDYDIAISFKAAQNFSIYQWDAPIWGDGGTAPVIEWSTAGTATNNRDIAQALSHASVYFTKKTPPTPKTPEPGTTAALGLFALTSLGLLKKAKKS